MAPVENQHPDPERRRVREALTVSVAERGYTDTTLADVLALAGIDADEFGRHYPSLEACFAEVWEQFVMELFERCAAAYAAAPTWRDGMRAQAWELYRFLHEDRLRARICVIEVSFGGELVKARRDQFMDGYVDLIQRGREEGGREDFPRPTAEAIFGAVWECVAAPLHAGEPDDLIDTVPPILYLLFLPYLGLEVAEEELRRGRAEVERHRAIRP